MIDALEAALEYAGRGWPVVPLWWPVGARCSCGNALCASIAKHPYGDMVLHGLRDATTNRDKIRRWWGRKPEANIGVVLGRAAGVVALDVDPKNGGEDTLAALIRAHGPLGETRAAITGSGGRHYFFRWPGRAVCNSVATLGPGLDVRGDGGYVVVAPSLHASGARYRWSDPEAPILDMPEWLLARVAPTAAPAKVRSAPPRTGLSRPRLPSFDKHRALDVMVRECAFIDHAIDDAASLAYEEWFSLATVLHPFPAGNEVFDRISRLDPARYDEAETKKKIATIRGAPRHCVNLGWSCPKLGECARLGVRSPAGLPYKLLALRKGPKAW